MILVVFSVKKPELYTVDHLFKNHFSKGSLLEVFKNSDKNTPVIVVRDYNNRNRKFHSYHKDWNVVNVMPLLYNKNSIYMVDKTKFDEDLIISTKAKFDSDEIFVLSYSMSDEMKRLICHTYEVDENTGVAEQRIRYRKVYHFKSAVVKEEGL